MASFRTFDEYGRENPCSGCPAPCCRAQVHTYVSPARFVDLDTARYRLLAGNSELVLTSAGDWYLVHWLRCALFSEGTCSCSAHGTPAKPKICVHYNSYDCWFRQTFVGEARGAVRLDRARFERFAEAAQLDDDGRVVSLPSFEETQGLVADLPVEPTFQPVPLPGATVQILERREA